MMPPASLFAGEAFLDADLPDPEKQAQALTRQLQVLLVAVVFLAPAALGRFQSNSNDDEKDPLVLRWLPRINLLGLLLAIGMILTSPHNLFTARSVFVAPLLTRQECGIILQLGRQAAQRNLERFPNSTELQQAPRGWRKTRHQHYPTTDLNWVTDSFSKEDRHYLAQRLHTRLAPLIHRIYGMVPASIRANDMFLVRYDALEGHQQALGPHTDESFVTFNILLNDGPDFEGGGTRFHNRRDPNQLLDVHPEAGQVLLNNAVIRHEGLPTTHGTRFILVGFLSIDRTKPFSGVPTGQSWFASWLYLPWAQVRFKQGCQAMAQQQQQSSTTTIYHDLLYLWYSGIANLLQHVGDLLSPHKVHLLVHPNNHTRYLEAMDAHPIRRPQGRASWFQQQRLITDVHGQVVHQVQSTHSASYNPRGEL